MSAKDVDRIVLWLQAITVAAVLVALVAGAMMLADLNRRTQDTLTLLSCIVLVDPDERGPEDIVRCLGQPVERRP